MGGLVGDNAQYHGLIISCFWDVETSRLSESDGGTGLTTAQMQDPNIFADAGWDFVHESDGPSDIWALPAGKVHPILWWQLPESQWPALPSFSGGIGDADDPYLISTPHELNSIGYNPRLMAAHFKLIEDIDLADVRFFIIGNEVLPFNGTFDGNGHAISNFSYTSTNRNHAGFFGYIDSPNAEIRNVGLIDPNVDSTTEWKVGSLVGQLERGMMTGCYVSGGSVSARGYIRGSANTGNSIVGGLVGDSNGAITDCHASCSVFGPKYVGGLLGADEGIITNCSFSGEAAGDDYVGGLVALGGGIITKCTSSGNVSGNDNIGGLIGVNSGEVTYCYSSSDVLSSGSEAGGLAGENRGTITDSYATGNTSGNNITGGLVGSNGYINLRDVYWEDPGHIFNCYSTGSVSGTSKVGGLLGRNLVGSITACIWDIETSGQATSAGGTGKTTVEMQTIRTFLDAGWDFVDETTNGTEDIWWILEGKDYPRLWWETHDN